MEQLINSNLFSTLRDQSGNMSNQSKLKVAYEEFTVELRKKLQSEMSSTDLYYNLGLIRLELVGIRDTLSDEQLSDIAQEYMDKLGYGDQPYLVYKHEDLDRKHIHIVSVRVDENGKKIDDSFEKRRSKDITRELEQKYNLLPAEKKLYSEQLPLKRVNAKAGDVKKQVANTAKALMKEYRFLSINEYRGHCYQSMQLLWRKWREEVE